MKIKILIKRILIAFCLMGVFIPLVNNSLAKTNNFKKTEQYAEEIKIPDSFVTNVVNFSSRASYLFGWALQINEEGFYNLEIERIYKKVINIVNGFFIVFLLFIAFAWNFSILIPRKELKRTFILFIIAAVSVNFALPINRLVLNTASKLQEVFSVVYIRDRGSDQNFQAKRLERKFFLDFPSKGDKTLYQGKTSVKMKDRLSSLEIDGEKIYENQKTVDTIRLSDRYVDVGREGVLFNMILLLIYAVGLFLIAVVISLRLVVLWTFLIISPFIFLLMILPITRGVFMRWLGLYGKWVIIGPLIILFLNVIVSIWLNTGIPAESLQEIPQGFSFVPNFTNINLSAPGDYTKANMSTPQSVMRFIIAILMLYTALILPFVLTKGRPNLSVRNFRIDKLIKKRDKRKKIFKVAREKSNGRETERNIGEGKLSNIIIGQRDGNANKIKLQDISNKNFSSLVHKAGTSEILEAVGLDIGNPMRNKFLYDIAQVLKKDSLKTQKEKNIKTIGDTLKKRAKSGDKSARTAIEDIESAIGFSMNEEILIKAKDEAVKKIRKKEEKKKSIEKKIKGS